MSISFNKDSHLQEIQWEQLMRSGKEDKIADIKKRIKSNNF
jgi:hypothetical protein